MIRIDTKKSASEILDYTYGRTIRALGIDDIFADANFGWATTGARLGGKSWDEIDGLDVSDDVFEIPFNAIFRRSRTENRGLSGPGVNYAVVCVDIESEGGIEFTVSLYPMYLSGSSGASITETQTGPVAREWMRLRFVVRDDDYDALRVGFVTFATSSARVWSVQVSEVDYQSLEFIEEPVALGDYWVGPYMDSVPVLTWATDGDAFAFDTAGVAVQRAFRKSTPAPGVNAVEFTGNTEIRTAGTVPDLIGKNLLFAVAVKANLSTPAAYVAVVGNALRLYRGAVNMTVHHYDASSALKARTFPTTANWMDVVVLCEGEVMHIWANGVRAAPLEIPNGHASGGTVRIGWLGHTIAMPAYFASDQISYSDALAYIDYRRHVHGIF